MRERERDFRIWNYDEPANDVDVGTDRGRALSDTIPTLFSSTERNRVGFICFALLYLSSLFLEREGEMVLKFTFEQTESNTKQNYVDIQKRERERESCTPDTTRVES